MLLGSLSLSSQESSVDGEPVAVDDSCIDNGDGTCAAKNVDLTAPDLGVPQDVSDANLNLVLENYAAARKYREELLKLDSSVKFKMALRDCENKHRHCAYWTATGGCQSNAPFMKVNCALLCGVCDNLLESAQANVAQQQDGWRHVPKSDCDKRTDLFRCEMRPQTALDYNEYNCDTTFDWFGYLGYMSVERIISAYQELWYYANPVTRDICLDIDSTAQICTSYRPHYHEMSVHYAARFLPSIKRVLFVGGGDSMLLHEILKYESLELVVGLELDQKVVRSSFKYFGVQPRFEAHDKVQWWFGDACKSLLMLPKDYFGSFDMVLVDLSETVMSFEVTKGMDIMKALTLLLQPDGIMLKNELYLEQLAEDFEHTLQYSFQDNPVICSQAMILGSNGVDFLHRELTDHKIDDVRLIQQLPDIEWRKEIFHDYIHNPNRTKFCKEDEHVKEPEVQEKSPGILMVVDAEKTTVPLEPSKAVEQLVVGVLKSEGLTVKSTVVSKANVVVVVLSEGYVTARTYPEEKYCAFDIHLWSKFEKQVSVKDALIAAVGSKTGGMSSHSYRVVAGGMFGVETWKEDEMKRGPRHTEECEKSVEIARDTPFATSLINIIMKETVDFFGKTDTKVVVLCGDKEENCESVDLMNELDSIEEVLTLWPCPGLKEDAHVVCGKQFVSQLQEFTSDGGKIRAIVLDPGASQIMGQIMHRIFTASGRAMLSPDLVIAAPILEESSDAWRRNFLGRFTTDIFTYTPAYVAKVLFNTTESSMEMGVFSNDTMFFDNVEVWRENIEKKTETKSEIESIYGGLWIWQEDWYHSLPTRNWKAEDYDQSSGLKQWNSQKPLGHHAIFQLEVTTPGKILSTELVEKSLKSVLAIPPKKVWSTTTFGRFTNLGNGCLFIAISDQIGSVFVLWDGNIHVDINLFTYEENVDFMNFVVTRFLEEIKVLEQKLVDEMPRGTGGVINFEKLDGLTPRKLPFWAGGDIKMTKVTESFDFEGKKYNVPGYEGLPM